MALTYILLSRHPANGGILRDGIEMALAYGAYELPVQLVFVGEAILALAACYRPETSAEGDYLSQLGALAMYDIVTPWVCAASLARFGLTATDLRIAVEVKAPDQLAALGPTLLVY